MDALRSTTSPPIGPLPLRQADSARLLFQSPLQKPPWDVRLHRNQVWNRLFIETFGYYLWTILLSRNRFERLEKAGDLGCWLAIGVFLPLGLEKVFNGWY